MTDMTIRLSAVTIHNFKNVTHGSLSFSNKRKDFKASVLGLYGQNGTGKTALIDALEIVRRALSGQTIPGRFADCINVDSETAEFIFRFSILKAGAAYKAVYTIHLGRTDGVNAAILREVLSLSAYQASASNRVVKVFDTGDSRNFTSDPKVSFLIGKDRNLRAGLGFVREMFKEAGQSFIFSKVFLDAVRKHSEGSADAALSHTVSLIEMLAAFGSRSLVVVNTADTMGLFMDVRSLGAMDHEPFEPIAVGEPGLLPEEVFGKFETAVTAMNSVLKELIPGLTLGVKDLGRELDEEGRISRRFQLQSQKNGKAIALKYESEGIKKLVSVLALLILVYNHPGVTVAIDELDAGVFEYLLGEILRILSEKGKGQLIFTSHNLRPLETLDPGFIAFTTVDPKNRYVRMNNLKDGLNLRDLYYRNIILGERSDTLYDETDNYEIALAFREAGEFFGR